MFAGIIPLGVLVAWAILFRPGVHKAHVTILGFFIIKNAVGRPRPDLLARCKPALGTPLHELVTVKACTETNHHLLHDGWRSFPSGHSSFSFSGLGYLSMIFAGQLRVFRPHTDLARIMITAAPLIGAFLVAASRIEDYRHDKYDVTVGSILGFLTAFLIYRRYYPALRSSSCDTPYPAQLGEGKGFSRLRDEEERVGDAVEFEGGDFEDDNSQELRPLNPAQH
ncbi:MAG: hypothetical protein M1820_003843 [Bogoriella megaspora]|nr:MAG: hypothetical protein M1820_003843 [Bogoriella megaspora]